MAAAASASSAASSPSSSSSAPANAPEWDASWLSHAFFWWVGPLFSRGNELETRGPLKEEDLFTLAGSDVPALVSRDFERELEAQQRKGAPNAVYAAVRSQFWRQMLAAGLVKFVNSTLQFAPPVFLNFFLQYVEQAATGATPNAYAGWLWAVGLFLVLTVRTCTENNYFHRVVRVGYQLRMAMTTAVYRKALRLSPCAKQDTPTGQIVNLMQLDASRLDSMCMQVHVIWDGAYQILGYMVLLYVYVGPASFAGLGAMLLLIPLNGLTMSSMGALRRRITVHNDNRIKVTNEVLQGIRAVKLYSWEGFFARKILGIRDEELAAVRAYALQGAVNSMLMQTAPILVMIVTLIAYVGSGGNFSAATVFTAISILNSLRFPLMFYPMVIQQVADARVSFERLNKFMGVPEVGDDARADVLAAAAAAANGAGAGTGPAAVAVAVAAAAAAKEGGAAALDYAASSARLAPSAAAARALPDEAVGLRVSKATFFWENPATRRARLAKKDEEAAAEAKKKQLTAKKPAAPAATAATAATAAPAAAAPAAAGAPAKAATPPAAAAAAAATTAKELGPALVGMDFAIPKGQLWAVVGSVGCGKSALVQAVLGELSKVADGGRVHVGGRVAYVPQSAWVLNASVRKNVVFAGEAHGVGAGQSAAERDAAYERVIDACQLASDIRILPAGDATAHVHAAAVRHLAQLAEQRLHKRRLAAAD